MRRPGPSDVGPTAVLVAGALFEALGRPLSPPGYVGSVTVNALGTLLVVLPAVVRRNHPRGYALAVILGSTLLWTQARGHGELPFAGYASCMLAAYTLGAHLARREAVAAGALTLAAWGVPDVIDARSGIRSVHQDLGFFVLVGLALVAGAGFRALRGQSMALRQALKDLDEERAAREAEAVGRERARIAHDMHDVLTHTVSALAVQAGALRRRLQGTDEAEVALSLEQQSREALRELRQLLGVLHDEGDLQPAPGLHDVHRLTRPLQATGVSVRVIEEGELSAVPAGPALVAYRLVQEALTNIAKHAPAARSVDVVLRSDAEALTVLVEDDGGNVDRWQPGLGLAGMRERVGAYGGTIRVGPDARRGWRLEAELPL